MRMSITRGLSPLFQINNLTHFTKSCFTFISVLFHMPECFLYTPAKDRYFLNVVNTFGV